MVQAKYTNEVIVKARELRKDGMSLKLISDHMLIPKSTIRSWVKHVPLKSADRKRLYTKKIALMSSGPSSSRLRREKQIAKIEEYAKTELETSSDREYVIAGAMLYWAEGDKTSNTSFTNSDPKMVVFMVGWLRNVCGLSNENLEARLHIHEGTNEKQAIKYWSKLLKLPMQNFKKSYVKAKGTGHRKNHLPNGIIRVRVCGTGCTNLRHKILKWADMYSVSKSRL